MNSHNILRSCLLLTLISFSNLAFAQSVKKEKMQQLSFLVGEWVGTSRSFDDNGNLKSEGPAFERISYDLDQHILVVELNSETLQLHTIIYYDEDDQTYYYNPFSKRGARKLPAELVDGKFVVNSSDERRFIFESHEENKFREYGEKLIDGKWVKYFEDTFGNTK